MDKTKTLAQANHMKHFSRNAKKKQKKTKSEGSAIKKTKKKKIVELENILTTETTF